MRCVTAAASVAGLFINLRFMTDPAISAGIEPIIALRSVMADLCKNGRVA